jgi:hypothetical protein
MNLYSYWANKNNIGTLGGSFDSSATMNPSVNPGTGMAQVLGGVNPPGNPQYSLGNNGICILFLTCMKRPLVRRSTWSRLYLARFSLKLLIVWWLEAWIPIIPITG